MIDRFMIQGRCVRKSTAQMGKGDQRQIPGLDGVRGLAVLLVIAYHYRLALKSEDVFSKIWIHGSSLGWCGVDIFFVLSGFLITGILLDMKGTPHYFRNFYARRTLRIFPLYFGVLAVVYLLLPLIARARLAPDYWPFHHWQMWQWTYLTNFGMAIHGPPAAMTSQISLGHFWTLSVEEHFYLFWPAIVFALSPRQLKAACIFLGGAALILRCVLAFGHLNLIGLTPFRLDTLCLGGLLAIYAREGPLTIRNRPLLVASLAYMTFVAWKFSVELSLPLHPAYQVVAWIAVDVLSVWLVIAGITGFALFRLPVLRAIGKYSYGIYVYHFLFFEPIKWNLPPLIGRHVHNPLLGNLTFLAIMVPSVLLFSVASYHLYESRFLKLKRFFPVGNPSQDKSGHGDGMKVEQVTVE